jgi:hypothetical protein
MDLLLQQQKLASIELAENGRIIMTAAGNLSR